MQEELDEQAENVIVGGGIVGLAVAHELLRRGRSAVVIERDRPGGGASGAAGGMLAPISEAEDGPSELVAFGRDSLGRYRDFVAGVEARGGISCGYRTEGTLWAAFHRDDLAELEHLRGTLAGKGLDCRELSADDVQQLEPHLSARTMGGLQVVGDHQVDPRRLCRCLELALRSLGGRVYGGMRVERIEDDGQRVRSLRGRGRDGRPFELRPRRVILAAGAWSGEGLELPEGTPRPRPIKGQLARLRGPRLLGHVVRTPDVYLVPRADGELLVGATMEEMGYDTSPTAGALMDLLRHAWEAVPGVYELELAEISVGLRSAVDDHLPVIGPGPVEGLYLAYGHYRNGVLLAPATAHYLVDWILDGVEPPALRPFSPRRLTGRQLHRGTAEAG